VNSDFAWQISQQRSAEFRAQAHQTSLARGVRQARKEEARRLAAQAAAADAPDAPDEGTPVESGTVVDLPRTADRELARSGARARA
jgi:hypothetical protein